MLGTDALSINISVLSFIKLPTDTEGQLVQPVVVSVQGLHFCLVHHG